MQGVTDFIHETIKPGTLPSKGSIRIVRETGLPKMVNHPAHSGLAPSTITINPCLSDEITELVTFKFADARILVFFAGEEVKYYIFRGWKRCILVGKKRLGGTDLEEIVFGLFEAFLGKTDENYAAMYRAIAPLFIETFLSSRWGTHRFDAKGNEGLVPFDGTVVWSGKKDCCTAIVWSSLDGAEGREMKLDSHPFRELHARLRKERSLSK